VIAPRPVGGLARRPVAAVAAAKHHTAAALASGELYTWGCNRDGRLGYPAPDTQATPRRRAPARSRAGRRAANARRARSSSSGQELVRAPARRGAARSAQAPDAGAARGFSVQRCRKLACVLMADKRVCVQGGNAARARGGRGGRQPAHGGGERRRRGLLLGLQPAGAAGLRHVRLRLQRHAAPGGGRQGAPPQRLPGPG